MVVVSSPTTETISNLTQRADHGSLLGPRGISSFEPLFRCLTDHEALKDAHFVTNCNALRKSLLILGGPVPTKYNVSVASRFDLEVVDGLILIHRWEWSKEKNFNRPPPRDVTSHSFHTNALAPFVEGDKSASGSSRIIGYSLNGLNLIVRVSARAAKVPVEQISMIETRDMVGETIRGSVDDQRRSTGASTDPATAGIKLVRIDRQDVPHDSLVDIFTTRSDASPPLELDLEWRYGRMAFSQVPSIVFATYSGNGVFGMHKKHFSFPPRKHDELWYIAKQQAIHVHRVAELLKWVITIVKQYGSVSLVSDNNGVVRVYRRETDPPALSTYALQVIHDARSG